jgi:hypothetical protein
VLPDGNQWTARLRAGDVAGVPHVATGEPYAQVDSCSATARVACAACNNGWMSELEGNVRPVLPALLLGEHALVEPQAASVLGRWCVKTAIVLASAAGEPWTPDLPLASALRSGALPAGHVVVSAARVPPGLDGFTVAMPVRRTGQPLSGALFVDAVRGEFAFSVALVPQRQGLPGWSVLMPPGWTPLLRVDAPGIVLRPSTLEQVFATGLARLKLLTTVGQAKLGPL